MITINDNSDNSNNKKSIEKSKNMSETINYISKEIKKSIKVLDMPYKTYSSGMRARVSFALSLAFEFDVYLIDEVTATGDLASTAGT